MLWKSSNIFKVLFFFKIFVTFVDIVGVMFSFTVFQPKKLPKNYHRSIKWVWHPLNLLASFRGYNKFSSAFEIFVYF